MKAPNGKMITGTLELIPGCEASADVELKGGVLEVEYTGDTDVNWNGQRSVKSSGGRVFIDSDGELWREQELISGEKDTSQPGPDEDVLVTLTSRELGTVLAALRRRQMGRYVSLGIQDIATNCGEFEPLSGVEIDDLCERINGGEA